MKSLLSYALLALTLAACDFFVYGSERAGCEGHPEFLRTLPDTTISLSGGPIAIPIGRDKPLVHHTGGQGFNYMAQSSNSSVAWPYFSLLDEQMAIIIHPLKTGTATIWVSAEDACEVSISTKFNVTIEP